MSYAPPKLRRPGTKPREKYLRIMHPAYTAHGIGFLTLSSVGFSRRSDRDRLADLDGAQPLAPSVTWLFPSQPGIDHGAEVPRG